jgi:hypothetical protein
MSTDPHRPKDGQFVVVQVGQKVTGPTTQQEAQQEADRRNKLREAQGHPTTNPATVKQHLLG